MTYVKAKAINEALGLSDDNIIYHETCDSYFPYIVQVEDEKDICYLEELIDDCDEVYATSCDSDEYVLVKNLNHKGINLE